MTITVRNVRLEDTEALVGLLRAQALFPRFEEETREASQARVREQIALGLADRSHTTFVAEVDGNLAGYAAVHWLPYLILAGPEGYVSELFVHPAFRSLGLGRRLLEAAKDEARSRGCSRLSLINFRNRASYQRGFYAKNGWKERPEAANFVLSLSDD